MLLLLSIVLISGACTSSSATPAQIILNSCDMYNHPQYGAGQCIEQNQCSRALYVPGLCEAHPSNIQCCFSKTNPILEEFRAVWVATVTNIDWPSSRTDTVAKQQTDLMDMLNTVQQLNMNAIVFQVTRQSD
jgi:hypothetical protein